MGWNESAVEANTVAFCQATHADPRCAASCLAVANCVCRLLQGEGNSEVSEHSMQVGELIDSALARADSWLRASGQNGACVDDFATDGTNVTNEEIDQWRAELRHYGSAESIELLELDEPQSIGYTFKCMGCALWALRSSASEPRPFATVISEVVRAGGDADTNGAVAGALIGARIGFSHLPQDWITDLAYSGWLEAWVQKLLWMFMLPVSAK